MQMPAEVLDWAATESSRLAEKRVPDTPDNLLLFAPVPKTHAFTALYTFVLKYDAVPFENLLNALPHCNLARSICVLNFVYGLAHDADLFGKLCSRPPKQTSSCPKLRRRGVSRQILVPNSMACS
jgi:hypothetical protein